jgi:biopolymer transport protein ExbD
LKGKTVDYAILETVPDPGNRTVTVLANPATPYAEVVKVLDKLHEMGFLISFESKK